MHAEEIWQPSKRLDRGNAAEQILVDLREAILSGRLPRGAKLPTEKKLADAYSVSGPTVREAIRGLTTTRLIEVRHGSGAYVTADPDQLIAVSLQSMIQLERVGVPDLLGVLNALNVHAAELAAVHATKADIASMRESLEVISKTSNPEEIAEALTRFLSVLSEAGGNPLLAALCRFLARIQIGLARKSSGRSLESWRKTTSKLTKARKALVDAIEARDRDAARAAARAYGLQSLDVITASPSVKTALIDASAMAELLASLPERDEM